MLHRLLAATVLFALALPMAAQAHRFLLVYDDAAALPVRPGVRLLERHERLGIAVAEAGSAEELSGLPGVRQVVEDRMLTASALEVAAATDGGEPDSLYTSPRGWAVREAGGFGSAGAGPWAVTRGKGVRIAILDSGVDAQHPDLLPNLALNLSEIDQSAATGVPSPCDDGSPADQQGHGTWAASLAAGAVGGGQTVGVAPEATLLNIKVMQRMPGVAGDASSCASGQAAGLLSWLVRGIDDAVAARADIISLSLGTLVDITTGDGAGVKAVLDRATHAAANAGVLLIAAAGNDAFSLANPRFLELPAQSRDVLAVVASTNPACAEDVREGAVCAAGPVRIPYYSNYGAPLHALAAPGGSYPVEGGWITAACSQGKPSTEVGTPVDTRHSFGCFGLGHAAYVSAIGTSASAPLAAGAAALVMAAHPDWKAADVALAMRAAAVPLAGMPAPLLDVSSLVGANAARNHHVIRQPVAF